MKTVPPGEKWAPNNKWDAKINIAKNGEPPEWVYIGVRAIVLHDGMRWDLVASNYDDVSIGGRFSKAQALHAIGQIWPKSIWQTEYLTEEDS